MISAHRRQLLQMILNRRRLRKGSNTNATIVCENGSTNAGFRIVDASVHQTPNEIEWFEAFLVCTLVSFYVLFAMHVVLYLNTAVQWEIVMNAGRFEKMVQ